MTTRTAQRTSIPVAWPLVGSFVVTAVFAAYVCIPPHALLHSWPQVFTRATLYLVTACCVHALTVWAVCAARKENEGANLPLILPVIWSAWIVVVWLPLISLLTAERSPWIAAVFPITAVFALLLLRLRRAPDDLSEDSLTTNEVIAAPFQLLKTAPMWWALLPAAITALAAEGGIATLVQERAWVAGCFFSLGAVYPVWRLLERSAVAVHNNQREPDWRSTAAGNSIIVWLLILLALVPFMAAYATGEISWLLGIKASSGPVLRVPSRVQGRSSGYTGIILVQPKKPHEIVAPAPMSMTTGSVKETKVIPFDGAYWYFKWPDTRPAPNATVTQGDPVRKRITSTDNYPLVMEAHQPLGKEVAVSCCRSLRLDVTNADNVPGTITVEVRLSNSLAAKTTRDIWLGRLVLPTSAVSPMPLHRPPVDDSLTFKMPRVVNGATFNEITVRIMPEGARSLAGAQVAIKDFVLQP